MSGPLQLRFVKSASEHGQLGESLTEVGIVGRSNVGKSSLLNALANRKSIARTSKTPGVTRLLNVFELDPEGSGRWLIDLPGYGYAKVPKHEQQRWAKMIEDYLIERESLDMVMVLIDGAVGPTALDKQSLDWFAHIGLTVRLVATKLDKVKPSKLGARKTDLAAGCGVEVSDIRWVSASKGTGIPELRDEIRSFLGEP